MSCWVVPSVAAEIWGTTIDHILVGVREGSIPTKSEKGFTFVDVAPDSIDGHGLRRHPLDRPSTYIALTEEETNALLAPLDGFLEFPDSRDEDEALDHLLEDIESSEEEIEEEDSNVSVENWREARKRVSNRRLAPIRLSFT